MSDIILLSRSTRKGKKFMVTFEDGKKIHFGADGSADYTIHKDPKRKERYIKRHQKNENWNDPRTAGFWSRWLLWNKPTIRGSKIDISRKFNINFRN